MSRPLLIIGNKNYSSWSLRPWVFMRHMGVEFEEKRVALFRTTTDTELAEYNSDFKVPVLKDGDLLVWDSLAILEYISEQYLAGNGWPQQAAARATARSVSSEMHSSFASVRNELPMNCRRQFHGVSLTAGAQREIDRIKRLWRMCREKYCAQGPWLFGDYSIADAMYAPIVMRFSGYNIELGHIERQYVQQVLQQAAIEEWVAAARLETEVIAEDEVEI